MAAELILAHSGWGGNLGLREVWPNVPQLLWPELWVSRAWAATGDPLKPPVSLGSRLSSLAAIPYTYCSG